MARGAPWKGVSVGVFRCFSIGISPLLAISPSPPIRLVPKMPNARQTHDEAEFVGFGDDFGVFFAASRLH